MIDRLDGVIEGLAVKAPCRLATTANITTLTGLLTVDGLATVAGDRVLVRAQDDNRLNGIYVASTGIWQRAEDFNGNRDVVTGTQVVVTSGTVYAGATFRLTTANPISFGVSSIAFEALYVQRVNGGWEEPFKNFVFNGDFQLWSSEPTSGSVQTAGSGAGFATDAICDGWYGGPGPTSQYTFTRPIVNAATGERCLKLTWNAGVSDGETQHSPAKRFTFLEYLGRIPYNYAAEQEITIEFDVDCTSASIQIAPVLFVSMGNSAWTASTVYVAGNIRTNASRLYTCATGGTSASSGGPSGTGAGITDGSVVWNYLGELKGREYEIYESSGTASVAAVANGVPIAGSTATMTTTRTRVKKTIYIPALNTVNSTTYAGHATDATRQFTPAAGGAYLGVGFDLYFPAGPIGPEIRIYNVETYRNPTPVTRPQAMPLSATRLLVNSFARLLEIYANGTVLLGARNSPFAKGNVTISGTTPTLGGAYGATVTYGGTTGRWDVAFTAATADTNYHPSIMAQTSNSTDAAASLNWNVATKTTSGFQIYFSSGADPEVYANPPSFSFSVMR